MDIHIGQWFTDGNIYGRFLYRHRGGNNRVFGGTVVVVQGVVAPLKNFQLIPACKQQPQRPVVVLHEQLAHLGGQETDGNSLLVKKVI